MTGAEKWARALYFLERVKSSRLLSSTASDVPRIEHVSLNEIICGGPKEVFSSDMPITVDENYCPIDVIYGSYFHEKALIEIYINNINRDARKFGSREGDGGELLEIVRLHEWAHAVVHLGVFRFDIYNILMPVNSSVETNWSTFIEARNEWFSKVGPGIHEFLAQSLTYAAVSSRDDLKEVFDRLEARQLEHYRLPNYIKQNVATAKWPLILEAARGNRDVEAARKNCDERFELLSGLTELVRISAGI